MLRVAFAGTFPASLEQAVRRQLTAPCEIVVASEVDILPMLSEIDVLVTMGLTAEMARAATRVKLVQVPGAGVDLLLGSPWVIEILSPDPVIGMMTPARLSPAT